MLIHQYIPAEHIKSLCERGLYFSSCADFVDKLEFRYGYCHFKYGDRGTVFLDTCIAESFKDSEIYSAISQSLISCWTQSNTELYSMWEVYGKARAAVRITVDSDTVVNALSESLNIAGAAGPVTYNFFSSQVRPQYLRTYGRMSHCQNERYDLFYHKHDFYRWENEFRFVLFPCESDVKIDASQIAIRVVLSPYQEMPPDLRGLLHDTFGNRLHGSSLSKPYC